MDPAALESMIEERLTVRQIAGRTGKSYSTVRYWLKKHGLATLHRGPGRASRVAGVERICSRHGAVRFVSDGKTLRCASCRSERVAARRRRVKQTLVAEAGGRCVACGYDRYVGALQFHHLDPTEKSFQLGLSGLTRSIAVMRAEAAKCVLLCANCHAEVEGGVKSLV